MARPQAPRGQGRARVLRAALELFTVHGVSGTSLQMIADHLGVTKAAVYYQFHAKEDIVLAAMAPAFEDMRAFVAEAEQAASAEEATDRALRGLVELVVGNRDIIASLSRDPEVERIVQSHGEYDDLTNRFTRLLLGPDPTSRRLAAVSLLQGGLGQAGIDPLLERVDDDALRTELLLLGRLLLSADRAASPAL